MDCRRIDSFADVVRLENFLPLLVSAKLSYVVPLRQFEQCDFVCVCMFDNILRSHSGEVAEAWHHKSSGLYYVCRDLKSYDSGAEQADWLSSHIVVLHSLTLYGVTRTCLPLLHATLHAVVGLAEHADPEFRSDVSLVEFLTPLTGVTRLTLDLCAFTDATCYANVFLDWYQTRGQVRLQNLEVRILMPKAFCLLRTAYAMIRANIADYYKFIIDSGESSNVQRRKVEQFLHAYNIPSNVSVDLYCV